MLSLLSYGSQTTIQEMITPSKLNSPDSKQIRGHLFLFLNSFLSFFVWLRKRSLSGFSCFLFWLKRRRVSGMKSCFLEDFEGFIATSVFFDAAFTCLEDVSWLVRIPCSTFFCYLIVIY